MCVCMFSFETKIVKKGMFIKIQNKKVGFRKEVVHKDLCTGYPNKLFIVD